MIDSINNNQQSIFNNLNNSEIKKSILILSLFSIIAVTKAQISPVTDVEIVSKTDKIENITVECVKIDSRGLFGKIFVISTYCYYVPKKEIKNKNKHVHTFYSDSDENLIFKF